MDGTIETLEKEELNNFKPTPDVLKDCLKLHYDEGLQDGYDENRTRYYIITELFRTGKTKEDIIADMENWYGRMGQSLVPNKLKEKILQPLEWAVKYPRVLSCSKGGSLKTLGYCLKCDDPNYECKYEEVEKILRQKRSNGNYFDESLFDRYNWGRVLFVRKNKLGFYAFHLYKIIREREIEKNLLPGDIVFIGYVEMRKRMIAKYRDIKPNPMDMCRTSRVLEEFGLIKRVVKGSRGKTRKQANGYRRILPIPEPPKINNVRE